MLIKILETADPTKVFNLFKKNIYLVEDFCLHYTEKKNESITWRNPYEFILQCTLSHTVFIIWFRLMLRSPQSTSLGRESDRNLEISCSKV